MPGCRPGAAATVPANDDRHPRQHRPHAVAQPSPGPAARLSAPDLHRHGGGVGRAPAGRDRRRARSANSPWRSSYQQLWSTELSIRLGDHALAWTSALGQRRTDGLLLLRGRPRGAPRDRHGRAHRRSAEAPRARGLRGDPVPALIYLALNPSGDAAQGGESLFDRHRVRPRRARAGRAPAPPRGSGSSCSRSSIVDDIVASAWSRRVLRRHSVPPSLASVCVGSSS